MTEKIPFDSEYQLHNLTQNHLKELFDLELVASEIQKDDLRFDNLAFDEKTNTFVIIEYKNELNLNVFNQVQEYRDLLLSNKEEFADLLKDSKEIDFENNYPVINRKKTEIFYQKLPKFKMNFDIDETNLIQGNRNNTPRFRRHEQIRDYFDNYFNENKFFSPKY